MQIPNFPNTAAQLAAQRFQQAIAQHPVNGLTSTPTDRFLHQNPSRIYTAPPPTLVGVTTSGPVTRRERAGHAQTIEAPVSAQERFSAHGKRSGQDLSSKNQEHRLYAKSLLFKGVSRGRGRPGARLRKHRPGYAPEGFYPPGSIFDPDSPANDQFVRQIESLLMQPLLVPAWLLQQILLNEKDPVRTEPTDLQEKLTKKEAESGRGRDFMKDRIKDPKIKGKFDKMEHIHEHGDGTKTEVHYLRDKKTGKLSKFKFKDTLESRGRLRDKRK